MFSRGSLIFSKRVQQQENNPNQSIEYWSGKECESND